jgi:hypothetical protein
MIYRFLILFSILLISKGVFGQADFYIDFTGAYSFIPKYEHVDELIFTDIFGNPSTVKFTEEYIVKPGFNIEVGLDKYIKDRFSVNSGIGFSYYQYKRETNLEFIENNETDEIHSTGQTGEPIGDYYGTQPGDVRFQDVETDIGNDNTVIGNPNYGKTKILYLAIPLRLHYSIVPDKFKIGIGLTNYFVAFSSQIRQTMEYTIDNNTNTTGTIEDRWNTQIADYSRTFKVVEYNDKSSNGLSNYQLTGEITLEYKIFKGLWIKTGYKNSFLSIYDKPQPSDYITIKNDKAKYRTVLIGLKYII